MKPLRLVSLMLVAILAVGLVVASVASAAPEFNPVGATVTGTSGTSILTAGVEGVTCAKDNFSGFVASKTLVGGILVHFLECTGKNSDGTTCSAMSPGAPLSNLIITKTLHGVLGLILPAPASGSDVALVVLPSTAGNTSFFTFLGSCIPESTLEGSVAGSVEPVGSSVLAGTIKFALSGTKQAITDVDLSTGGLIAPKLKAFGVAATESTTENIKYDSDTEVT